ncbi:MAG TPA: hypothetical protein VLZ89_05765 [Anaerolineales bacterium]|nr:hypothetical protein [Anaerolineales bacterium]
MSRTNLRFFIGGALILLGVLMLLQRLNIFSAALDIFWCLIFLAGGVYFLYRFALNNGDEWWALIPGCALLGAAASTVLPERWSGLAFLGLLGAGFFAVYLTGRQRWWAIIPGGVLVTLGFTAALTNMDGARQTGGFFFLGLGLTFLLVAVLASMPWAYIPGVILLLMGAALGYPPMAGALNYLWPAALILIGLLLILQFTRSK